MRSARHFDAVLGVVGELYEEDAVNPADLLSRAEAIEQARWDAGARGRSEARAACKAAEEWDAAEAELVAAVDAVRHGDVSGGSGEEEEPFEVKSLERTDSGQAALGNACPDPAGFACKEPCPVCPVGHAKSFVGPVRRLVGGGGFLVGRAVRLVDGKWLSRGGAASLDGPIGQGAAARAGEAWLLASRPANDRFAGGECHVREDQAKCRSMWRQPDCPGNGCPGSRPGAGRAR